MVSWWHIHAVLMLCCGMVAACGEDDTQQDGFVLDNSFCAPTGTSIGTTSVSGETQVAVESAGTNEFAVAQGIGKIDAEYVWGIDLRLAKDSNVTKNMKVGMQLLVDSPDKTEAGTPKLIPARNYEKEQLYGLEVGRATVTPNMVTTSLDWVRLRFTEPVRIKSEKVYWFTFIPEYGTGASSHYQWSTVAGRDYGVQDPQTGWEVSLEQTGTFKIVKCTNR